MGKRLAPLTTITSCCFLAPPLQFPFCKGHILRLGLHRKQACFLFPLHGCPREFQPPVLISGWYTILNISRIFQVFYHTLGLGSEPIILTSHRSFYCSPPYAGDTNYIYFLLPGQKPSSATFIALASRQLSFRLLM